MESRHGTARSLRIPLVKSAMDGTVANIDGRLPEDLDCILPDVDQAYADSLGKLGASFMLSGAI